MRGPLMKRLRMRHRYLDLRREAMQENMLLRHKTVKFIRDFLDKQDFIGNRDAHLVQDLTGRRA